jgi:DNA invertase Pin-like site-specific DNA recombinase
MKNNINTTKRCVIYARTATKEQSLEKLNYQINACKEISQQSNLLVIKMYQHAGVSGLHSFQRFIGISKYCRAHNVDTLLTFSFDRISLNIVEYLAITNMLEEVGVRIITITPFLLDMQTLSDRYLRERYRDNVTNK